MTNSIPTAAFVTPLTPPGKLYNLTLPDSQLVVSMPKIPDVSAALRALVGQIGPGQVATYGQIAQALGSSHAAKWVANWLISEPSSPACPTHRVVRADGSLGNYRGRSAADQALALEVEGVAVIDGKVDLFRHRSELQPLSPTAPLSVLADWQVSVAGHVSLEFPAQLQVLLLGQRHPEENAQPRLVGGVDVSYVTPTRAVAAYALVDVDSGELVWSLTHEHEVAFPYISGFLSMREIPIILPLLDAVRAAGKLADVLFVDGHGTLHHRRMGIASHLGLVTGLSTIGVGKTLPLGEVDLEQMAPGETRPITSEGQIVGTALRPFSSRRPLYFSAGHRIDLQASTELVCRLTTANRLPNPTYWADRISREAARLIAPKAGEIDAAE